MVTVTFDGTDMKFYTDGVLRTSVPTTLVNFMPSHIGNSNGLIIDEMGMWSQTLQPENVIALYNGGNGISYETITMGS